MLFKEKGIWMTCIGCFFYWNKVWPQNNSTVWCVLDHGKIRKSQKKLISTRMKKIWLQDPLLLPLKINAEITQIESKATNLQRRKAKARFYRTYLSGKFQVSKRNSSKRFELIWRNFHCSVQNWGKILFTIQTPQKQ